MSALLKLDLRALGVCVQHLPHGDDERGRGAAAAADQAGPRLDQGRNKGRKLTAVCR